MKPNPKPLQFVRHRVNDIEGAAALPENLGAELDLRAGPDAGEIFVHHDPWSGGVSFEEWLRAYANKPHEAPLILNTKEDGLEARVMDLCRGAGVENFFFLDTALPTLVKWALREGESRFACRVSAHEPSSSLDSFRGKVDWLWVDCFDGIPLPVSSLKGLLADFKLCLVSPELQGMPLGTVGQFEELFHVASAVCTKNPGAWKERFL